MQQRPDRISEDSAVQAAMACFLLLHHAMQLKWVSSLPLPIIITLLVLVTILVSIPAFPITR